MKRDDRGEQPQDDGGAGQHPLACRGFGCPLVGTVQLGVGWLCHCHAWVDMGRWQGITQLLRQHAWLLAHKREVEAAGADRWRRMAEQFWSMQGDPECGPHAAENRALYLYRLHWELEWRVGARAAQPWRPMEPQRVLWPPAKGPTGDLAGAILEAHE